MEERKIARATHKQAMTKLNEENKKKQYEAALDANLPALNANSHIKKKPYQKTSSAACRTREMYSKALRYAVFGSRKKPCSSKPHFMRFISMY